MIFDKKSIVESKTTILLSLILATVGSAIFIYLAHYIDFHPDESIYYDAIPISMRKDVGLFYSLYYTFCVDYFGGVSGARVASAVLGGGSLFFILLSIRLIGAGAFWLCFISLIFILSYQSIFIFDRVRPEAAWWFLSTMMIYGLLAFEVKSSWLRAAFVMFVAILLPMNHQVSWFACLYSVGYILAFTRLKIGLVNSLVLVSSIALGVILNVIIRANILSVDPMPVLATLLAGTGGGIPQSIADYFHLVFVGSPLFLSDTAVYPNLYELIGLESRWATHAYIQTLFWLLMFALPFITKSWRVRYAISFPLFAFILFYITGYYNPTYSAGFSLFSLLAAIFLAVNSSSKVKGTLILIGLLSILNGMSFITTRVLNHGEASFYIVEQKLQDIIDKRPTLEKVALPERFLSLSRNKKFTRYSDFKDQLPEDLDLLIYDDYDFQMYTFVPNFAEVSEEIIERAESMCLFTQMKYPVYIGDKLFPTQKKREPYVNETKAGSWFFRNSVSYTIYVFEACRK